MAALVFRFGLPPEAVLGATLDRLQTLSDLANVHINMEKQARGK